MPIPILIATLWTVMLINFAASAVADNDDGIVAWWKFEKVGTDAIEVNDRTGEERTLDIAAGAGKSENDPDDEHEEWIPKLKYFVTDDRSAAKDRLIGFHKRVRGVSGGALQLGGIGSFVARRASEAPSLLGPFTIEGWIALGAYPVNWCSLLAQADADRGLSFGVDALGRVGIRIAASGQWVELISNERIGLAEWTHVACSYDRDKSLKIYINGKPTGEEAVAGDFEAASDQDLLIGKEGIKRKPTGTIRPHATKEVHTYFDGLLDELKLYDRALNSGEIVSIYDERLSVDPPELPRRRLPIGSATPGPFGAYYATLRYYDAWDAQWRVGGHADVVVRFDENPCHFVFWRGTSYIPNWVTENGIWYNNQFNETWSEHGCHEPMSDKQCRHSQVRIIESNAVRVVVHWRYALVDNWYEFARVEPGTGIGEWTDEVFTIYPDGVGVRQVTLRSMSPGAPHEWHEGIIVMGPGQRPEDVLQPGALTLMNMKGEEHTYSWLAGAPDEPTQPPNANIQIVNTKSVFRPFIAVLTESEPTFDIYDGELRRDVSMFPWWNHWPTAFDPCDGRYAQDADRASHSSLTHCYWKAHTTTENSMTKIMLNGVTNGSAEDVWRLAKSWDSPPQLTIESDEFSSALYDATQRAYVTRRAGGRSGGTLRCRLEASEESPVENLAVVIENWGAAAADVAVNGQPAKSRTARRTSLESDDLIVWIEHRATSPVTIAVQPGR